MIDGDYVRAWRQAALTGAAFAGKLPRLDPRLRGEPRRTAQTWQEQKAIMQVITAAHMREA